MLIFPGSLQCLYFNTLFGGPKDKYCLTACLEPKIRFLLINSEPSSLKRDQPEMWECQVLIDHRRHTFLDYNSYIDCTDPHAIPMENIEAQLAAKPSRKLGRAEDDVIERVREAIENSPTIPTMQIRWMLEALEMGR